MKQKNRREESADDPLQENCSKVVHHLPVDGGGLVEILDGPHQPIARCVDGLAQPPDHGVRRMRTSSAGKSILMRRQKTVERPTVSVHNL